MSSLNGPSLALAILLAIATSYHLRNLVAGVRRNESGLDLGLSHILMGVAMIWMLVAPMNSSAARWLATGFGLGAGWLAVVAVRRYVVEGAGRVGQAAIPALGCAAMTYMLAPRAGSTGRGVGALIGTRTDTDTIGTSAHGAAMSGMTMTSGGGVTVLTMLLLTALTAVTAWTLRPVWAAWRTRAAGQPARRAGSLAAVGCQLVMTGATTCMLVALL